MHVTGVMTSRIYGGSYLSPHPLAILNKYTHTKINYAKNPDSFHARIYFMTNSRSTGPKLLSVAECSLLCVVSSIMPPQDMRKKSASKKSTSRTAGFSDGVILGGQLRTR